jgi:transposase
MNYQPLTDLQWHLIEPLFPMPEKRSRGKPHTSWRKVMNSILYVLTTKTKWDTLPKTEEFASKSAAHRWYKVWKASGLLDEILSKIQELSGLTSDIKFPRTRHRNPKPKTETPPHHPIV